MSKSIYLDYNATGILRPEVVETLAEYFAADGNPSSVHHRGRAARGLMEEAREKVAALVNASAANVIFTGSGTEANNQAVRAVGAAAILMSTVEHDSTIAAAYASGAPVFEVLVNRDGLLDLGALKTLLAEAPKPALVTVLMANNETGVIQPIAEIAAIAREFGALVHTDAIQAAGKIPVDFETLGVDLMSLSAHKLNALAGTGALVVKPEVNLNPLIYGGGQERGWRSGTENLAGIVAFGRAAELAIENLENYQKISVLRDFLEAEIKTFCPQTTVFGGAAQRLPNTTNFTMPGVSSDTQAIALDLEGFCVSTGAACSSGKVKASHVLTAMGYGPEVAGCALRVSLGWQTEMADLEAFIEAWKRLYTRTHGEQEQSGAAHG